MLLKVTGLTPAAMHRLMERLREGPTALDKAQVGQHLAALTASSYHGSWFTHPGSTLVAFPLMGTVPGQQLGDV
eukprot:9498884-Pyramimonas_sp.AAC.1